jgi:hypothetical protein
MKNLAQSGSYRGKKVWMRSAVASDCFNTLEANKKAEKAERRTGENEVE